MSDQELGREFSPSEDEETDENRVTGLKGTIDYGVPLVSDQLSVWLQNAPTFSSNCMGEAHEGYSSMLNEVSSFDVPSSVQSEQMNHGEVSHSKEMILSELEKGQSSGTKRMHASDSLGMQTKESDLQEDGEEKGPETSNGCKPQKRTRSAEVHNLNERLRRQKLKEKIKALRELIPNCNKRDKASTLDDAIKYIKTLQYQVQMMSIGAGYPTFHSPLTMMPQPGQRTLANSTFLQTGGLSEMTYEIGMPMPGRFSPLNFPTSQLGLPDQYLLPSSAASGLPGISAAAHSVQNPGNFLYATSFQSSGSQSTTPGDQTSPSQGAK